MAARIGIFLLVSLLTLLVVLPSIPLAGNLPLSDSAIFIYISKEILQGKILYVDIINNQTPGIFFINAIGLLLTKNSYWGIWILEYLTISAVAWLGFLLTKKIFGTFAAITATIMFLLSIVLLYEYGNQLEFYGVFFQFLAIYLFTKTQTKGSHLWKFFFIGCCSAGSFLLRANLFGTHLVIFILVLYQFLKTPYKKKLLLQILSLLGGIFFSIFPWILYFAFNNALGDAISAAFLINMYHSASPVINKIASAINGISLLSATGLTLYAFLGLLLSTIAFWKKDKHVLNNQILLIAIIDLPLEMMLSSISGRNYLHYYTAWLPSLTILTAYFIFWYKTHIFPKFRQKFIKITTICLYALAIMLPLMFTALHSINIYLYNITASSEYYKIGDTIKKTTKKNDAILAWGHARTIYLVTGREAAGKYIHQSLLFLPDYSKIAIKTFYADIVKKPPKYIIDNTTKLYHFPSFDKKRRKLWIPTHPAYKNVKEFDIISSFIEKNYYLSDTLQTGWRIYKLTE